MNRPRPRRFSKLALTASLLAAAMVGVMSILDPLAAHAQDCSDVFSSLSQFVVDGVNADKGAYVQAMNETGVPWELLAAIHYRETAFSHTNPGNGQGIFQFAGGEGGPYPPGPVSGDEFYRQLKFMASKLQSDYVWRGNLPRERRQLRPNETNVELVKDTIFSYNGRAAVYANQAAQLGFNRDIQPYEGSPYVMNRFDCPRARMGIITRDYGSLDGIDTRYGAFTIFARLRGDDYWHNLWTAPFAGLGDSFILAKSDDPNDLRQWVMYGGIKQYIPDPQTLNAWGLQNQTLVTVSGAAMNLFTTGPNLDRLARLNGDMTVYFIDNGRRYRVQSPAMMDTWNFNGTVISSVSPGLFNITAGSGDLPYSLRDPTSNAIYALDGSDGNGHTVLRQYGSAAILYAWEGDGAPFITVSTDYWSRINQNIGSMINTTKVTYGGAEYQVVNGQKMSEPVAVAPLYPAVAQPISTSTYNRLGSNGSATHLLRAAGSPDVYLLDGGTRHHILSPDVLAAWQTSGYGVSVVNSNYLSIIPESSPLGAFLADAGGQLYIMDSGKVPVPSAIDGAYRRAGGVYLASSTLMGLFAASVNQATAFVKGAASPQVYIIDNSGQRRHLQAPDIASLWGAYQSGITVLSDYVVNSFASSAPAAAYVSDGSNEYMMEGGQKLTLNATNKAAWGLSGPQVLSDGTLGRFATGNPLDTSFRTTNGLYALAKGGALNVTTDPAIAQAWGLQNAPVHSSSLLITERNVMLARYVRSTAPGDGRVFLVDNNQWYHLSGAEADNLAFSSQPVMGLDPGTAGGTIVDLANPIVQNGQGTHFVVDGGGKRVFPSATVDSYWTNNGQLAMPTVSDGFLASLPTKGFIERAIKGTSTAIYAAPDNTKLHILSPDTFARSYAPFVQVSDSLISVLPEGQAIQ